MLTTEKEAQVYLASLSPRRAELLDQLKLRYQILKPQVKETFLADETPSECVLRLAQEKSEAGLKIAMDKHWPIRPIIAADTLVVIDGEFLGKPRNQADAKRMLTLLSGRTHQVLTGVALRHQELSEGIVSESQVSFKTLTNSEIEAYWESGEPLDKAGAYAIQGIGACFIEKLNGSYSGVMGLPIFETSELLAKMGLIVI